MNNERPTHSYIGRCRKCKAVVAVCVDMPSDLKATAGMVADIIRSGCLVTCVPFDTQTPLESCRCPKVIQVALL